MQWYAIYWMIKNVESYSKHKKTKQCIHYHSKMLMYFDALINICSVSSNVFYPWYLVVLVLVVGAAEYFMCTRDRIHCDSDIWPSKFIVSASFFVKMARKKIIKKVIGSGKKPIKGSNNSRQNTKGNLYSLCYFQL